MIHHQHHITTSVVLEIVSVNADDARVSALMAGLQAPLNAARGALELNWLVQAIRGSDRAKETHLAGLINDKVVAIAIYLQVNEGVVLHFLHVLQDFRRVGVGAALLRTVCENADGAHIMGLALPGDRAMKNLYEQNAMPAKVIMAAN